jgi:HlyD family secretion protein
MRKLKARSILILPKRTAIANLEKAKAALAIARQSLADAYIRAPFSGVIAAKSKQAGELVTASDQIFYLLGEGGLEVFANVPEVNIAKIKVGDQAAITLDAYGSETIFPVTVSEIDPAETFIDGVATYKVTFAFPTKDDRIRSGMTAYIVVTTAQHEGVLYVPTRAVTSKDGKRTVRITTGENQEEQIEVTTGLQGTKGEVEIVSGLTEGQQVIVGVQQ